MGRIAGRNNILGSIPQDRGRYYDCDDIDLLMEQNLDNEAERLADEELKKQHDEEQKKAEEATY
jgi:hypothetical protein